MNPTPEQAHQHGETNKAIRRSVPRDVGTFAGTHWRSRIETLKGQAARCNEDESRQIDATDTTRRVTNEGYMTSLRQKWP